jgi:hypothetical protein
MITIISHRGYWYEKSQMNQEVAFKRSWKNGFGIETDVRDFNQKLVISHDLSSIESMDFDRFIEMYLEFGNHTTLALNIKADGLASLLKLKLENNGIENYFVFDMSVPDTKRYITHNLNIFSRQSELEKEPIFYSNSNGVWLDAFDRVWYSNELVQKHLIENKKIAIVSPELHGREHKPFWQWLKINNFHIEGSILICTDFPLEAKHFFYE